MATQNTTGVEQVGTFRIGHNRTAQVLTPDRKSVDFNGQWFRLGNVVRSDARVYPEDPRGFIAAFLALYGKKYLEAVGATPEQAKLKPVQDLIWKRFLTNRVEHTDGRVFVTAKDARLPKLGGPVSVKDTEAGISPADLDAGFSFTVSAMRLTNVSDAKGGGTSGGGAVQNYAPVVQISEDDEELKRMREELAAMRSEVPADENAGGEGEQVPAEEATAEQPQEEAPPAPPADEPPAAPAPKSGRRNR